MKDICENCVYYANGICVTNGATVAPTKDYCSDYINKYNAEHEFNEIKAAVDADFYWEYYDSWND